MDTKRLHSIVGIVILFPMVIIVLAVFFGSSSKETPNTVTHITHPVDPNPIASTTGNVTAQPTSSPESISLEQKSEIQTLSTAIPAVETASTETEVIASEENTLVEPQPAAVIPVQSTHAAIKEKREAPVPFKKIAHAVTKSSTQSALSKKGWVVQLGTFKNKNNAARLIEQLRKAGFQVTTHSIKISNQWMTQVALAPVPEQTEAARLHARVQKIVKIKSMIVKKS